MKPLKKEKYKLSIQKIFQKEYEDDFQDDCYQSQDLEYNDCYFYELYEPDDGKEYYTYTYIPQLNIFSTNNNIQREESYDDEDHSFDIYIEDDIYYLDVFTYTSESKKEAFFGCVIKAVLNGGIKKPKLLKIFDIITETYPEIYFKLIGNLK